MNTETDNTKDEDAWHRQPTVWIVLGVLAFTVVSSIILLILALSNPPELIDKNAVQIEAPADTQEHG